MGGLRFGKRETGALRFGKRETGALRLGSARWERCGLLSASWERFSVRLTRGRRVVHRTQILVGESTEYLLVFWEDARRGFMSVRGEQETVG